MEKKHVVLLTVIAVATLLITVVGATFAWFTVNVQRDEDSKDEIQIGSATLAITYDDGKEVNVNNIVPGWQGEKTITVEYPQSSGSDVALFYNITWDSITNTFAENEQSNLVYTYEGSCTSGLEGVTCDEAGNRVPSQLVEQTFPTAAGSDGHNSALLSGKIKKGEKHTYKIVMKYKNIEDTQNNHDVSGSPAKFNATFKIEAGPTTITED